MSLELKDGWGACCFEINDVNHSVAVPRGNGPVVRGEGHTPHLGVPKWPQIRGTFSSLVEIALCNRSTKAAWWWCMRRVIEVQVPDEDGPVPCRSREVSAVG